MTESPVGSVDIFYVGEGPRVAILGDSLIVQSLHVLRPMLDGLSLKIAAVSGEGLSGGALSTARQRQVMLVQSAAHREDNPDVAVVALGTNDALDPNLDTAGATAAWDQMMEDFSDSTVIGVTVNESCTAEGFDPVAAREINALMHRDAATVVDWNAVASDPSLTGADGIHQTTQGQHLYAALIHSAILGCLELGAARS